MNMVYDYLQLLGELSMSFQFIATAIQKIQTNNLKDNIDHFIKAEA